MPRLALTNAGVDTNVFNEASGDGPESDVTITLTPSAELWLPMGPTWLSGTVREDTVWFRKFVDQRSVNSTLRAAWLVPLNRISFHVGSGWVRTHERPGFEIDARPERRERDYNGTLEIRALSRTRFGVRGERRHIEFEEGEAFLGTDLREELSRTTTIAALTVRHEVTPLTTLLVSLAREQDRFEFAALRDSNTNRVELGLEFDPYALISGSARIGFRRFDPAAGDLEGYSGTTASVNVAWVARGATRLALQVIRDVEYSFEATQPYYILSGVSGSVRQQIYGPIDAEGHVGGQRLAYRTRGADPLDRTDRVRAYGGGIGYRIGRDLRVGFNVDHHERTSRLAGRSYDGLRYGMTATYGR